MERKIIFNYNNLNKFITEQQKDLNRTDWELTMLRNNFMKYLSSNLNKIEEYYIRINESTWDIIIDWQKDLQNKFRTLPTWYKMNNKEKLYHQIKQALEEAKYHWIYDKVFKEIKMTK